MGSIYHNAVCTIAATCADSVADGFLSKVDNERISAVPCEVIHRVRNGGALCRSLKPRDIDLSSVVDSSTLNERGWVTQDAIRHLVLSNRIYRYKRSPGRIVVASKSCSSPLWLQLHLLRRHLGASTDRGFIVV